MIRCVEKQLIDFLPGGQYSTDPTKEDLMRTSYAHTTNLGCEHHFGDLDSSQKRRPNASMHHHTTVQLLKRNRLQMMEWLKTMPDDNREQLMRDARKGGRALRQSHLAEEKQVLKDIHEDMMCKSVKGKKRKRQDAIEEVEEDDFPQATYSVNEYVVVAYQDMWYPGIIEKATETALSVNFLSPTSKPGYFTWPARKDVQRVAPEFVIRHGFVPECKSSGRLWYIEDHKDINTLFEKYRKLYF